MEGSISYQNWKRWLADEPWKITFEYPLFSDAWITSELTKGLGPYQIINNVSPRSRRPAMTLRVQGDFGTELPDMNKTRDESYHGGLEQDELASLVSLCLGVRVRAGGMNRTFGRVGDTFGRPQGSLGDEDPDIDLARPRRKVPILPNAISQHSLEDARIIGALPDLSPQDATNLIRAARMYQEAIWNVEIAPELSWLLLVSAVETIANQWRETRTSNAEQMRVSYPKVVDILTKHGGDQLVLEVAEELAQLMGSTKTFIAFINEFLPPEPSARPHLWAQVAWTESEMKKTLNLIYKCRSRALHGGHPFPAPMCQPPHMLEDGVYAEFPVGLATAMKGGVWVAKDTPMYFHTFEYIARNAILNWWKSLIPETKTV